MNALEKKWAKLPKTVSEQLRGIETAAELDEYARYLKEKPDGCVVKEPTKEDWEMIARMKIVFQGGKL